MALWQPNDSWNSTRAELFSRFRQKLWLFQVVNDPPKLTHTLTLDRDKLMQGRFVKLPQGKNELMEGMYEMSSMVLQTEGRVQT